MQVIFNHGYPDYIGKRFAYCGYGNGPASYVTGGDPIQFSRYQNYIDSCHSSASISGNYVAVAIPSGVGARATWSLVWKFNNVQSVASLAIATAGSGQTPGTYTVAATGGGGSGATASITVAAGGTVTAIPVITNPGKGYTSAPTFTLAAGGTPATFTPSLSTPGLIVSAGANLSAEQVVVDGFGGQY